MRKNQITIISTLNLFRLDDGTKSNELHQCLQSNFLKNDFHIFQVSKPTVSLCVMYEVKLGWKWCTPRFQRTRRRESLSTDQVRYKNKINQCMGESSFGFGLDPNYFMVWCGILDGLLVKCGGRGRGWTIERCVIIYENADLRNKLSDNARVFLE